MTYERRGMQDMNTGRERSPELVHREPRVLSKYTQKARPSQISHPTCGVCQHDFRSHIEMLLVMGQSYRSIEERITPKVSRQSISNHYKKHMDLQDAALRSLIEREAVIQGENHEDGVRDLVTVRGALEVALRRGYEGLVDKSAKVEPRDLIQIARVLGDMDQGREQAGLDEARAQVQIFMKAIKAVCPPEMIQEIVAKVRELREEDPSFAGFQKDPNEVVSEPVMPEPATLESGEDDQSVPSSD